MKREISRKTRHGIQRLAGGTMVAYTSPVRNATTPAALTAVATIAMVGAIGLTAPQVHAQENGAKSQPASTSPRVVNGPTPDEPEAPPTKPEDARGYEVEPPIDNADVGLFVPRAILFVPKLALQALWWPFTETLAAMERHAVLGHVKDVLYNDERTAGILPLLSVNTVFGPSVGATAFHDDLGGHGEEGRISAKFGGQYDLAYQVSFFADRAGGSRLWLESISRYEAEPNVVFQGIGHPPDGGVGRGVRDVATETRYRHRRLMLLNRVGLTMGEPGGQVQLGGTLRYTNQDFGAGPDDGVSIEEVYDTAQLVGFDSGYSLFGFSANLVVDTRDVKGATTSGMYLELFAGGVPPIRAPAEFWHWGFEATGYIPLYRTFRLEETRVLVLRAAVESVEGSEEDIPMTELPRLGGANRLRGYPLDRFRDRHAAVATIEYHYPVHQFVAGALYLDAGKVAQRYRDFFRDTAPRFGGGFGFIVRSRESQLFTVDVAYGDGVQVHFTTDPLRAFAGRDEQL